MLCVLAVEFEPWKHNIRILEIVHQCTTCPIGSVDHTMIESSFSKLNNLLAKLPLTA